MHPRKANSGIDVTGRNPDSLWRRNRFYQMKVVIFCGGLGTRLREETEFRPKPMVPVGERPILWHIMKIYAHYGHKDFILCLGYKGDVIKEYFRNYQWNTSDVTLRLGAKPQIKYHSVHDEEDWTVTLVDTGLNTMTGGRLKHFSQHPVRYWIWTKVSKLNTRHMPLAWTTLGTLVLTDFYVMLVASGAISDLRFVN